jgi:hypothetical protein
MQEHIRAQIESAIGRPLSPDEQASVSNLNEVPAAVIDAATRLQPIARQVYLRYVTVDDLHRYLPVFETDVVENKVPAEAWCKGGMILPDFTIADLLGLSVADLLAPLERRPDEPWLRLPADRLSFDSHDPYCGAPGLQRPTMDYAWQEPPHVYRVILSTTVPEPVDDIVVATRRWVASRAAAAARAFDVDESEEVERLAAAIAPSLRSLSDDVRIALRALILERRAGLADGVPGFLGPDAWYRGKWS